MLGEAAGALIGSKLPVPLSALLALLLLAQPAPPPGAAIERFFVGTTEGIGTVDVMLSGRRAVRDRNRGRLDRSGALILDQIVEEEGRPSRRRTWRLARAGGNRIAGTISDARGAVTGEVTANTLHLRYRLAEGPSVDQLITLAPNGRTATNRMTFRRFGLRVATAETVIRKVD